MGHEQTQHDLLVLNYNLVEWAMLSTFCGVHVFIRSKACQWSFMPVSSIDIPVVHRVSMLALICRIQ